MGSTSPCFKENDFRNPKRHRKIDEPVTPNKKHLFAVDFSVLDYQEATEHIMRAARSRRSFGVSALAVHGLMECVWDPDLARSVNRIDMVVPDGQPVRWALNSLCKTKLEDRVSGPELTRRVLQALNESGLGVFLYGSTAPTLEKFSKFIRLTYPQVQICGLHEDRFRNATPEEDRIDTERINSSGACVVLVGRGCPRQERWVAEHLGRVNAAMMAVGAAFDFFAGNIKLAPHWMQRAGLEWLYRLAQEPGRLWKRYLKSNSAFLYHFAKHKLAGMFKRERAGTTWN